MRVFFWIFSTVIICLISFISIYPLLGHSSTVDFSLDSNSLATHNLFTEISTSDIPFTLQATGTSIQVYTTRYTPTNLYTNDSIVYFFEDLTPGVDYTWTLQKVAEDGRTVLGTVANRTFNIAPTFSSTFWFIDESHFLNITSPIPLRMVDNWGNIIGRHFIAPRPHSSWRNGPLDVVGIGNKAGQGPAYILLSPAGIHHDVSSMDFVTTLAENYALIHYRIDSFDVLNRWIHVNMIQFPTFSELYISMEDVEAYQRKDVSVGDTQVFLGEQIYQSFVVVTTAETSGQFGTVPADILPFIDNDHSDSSFGLLADRNPHRASFARGIFDYALKDDGPGNGVGALVNAGESVWVVADRVPEWSVSHRPAVTAGNDITVTVRAKTELVWGLYPQQILEDSLLGLIDNTVYPFNTTTIYTYTVSTFSGPVSVLYTRIADIGLMNFGQNENDYRFEFLSTYNIETRLNFRERIELHIENSPLDRDIFTLILFITAVTTVFILFSLTIRPPNEAYGVAFILLGLAFIVFGIFTLFLNLMVGLLIVVTLFTMIALRRQNA